MRFRGLVFKILCWELMVFGCNCIDFLILFFLFVLVIFLVILLFLDLFYLVFFGWFVEGLLLWKDYLELVFFFVGISSFLCIRLFGCYVYFWFWNDCNGYFFWRWNIIWFFFFSSFVVVVSINFWMNCNFICEWNFCYWFFESSVFVIY